MPPAASAVPVLVDVMQPDTAPAATPKKVASAELLRPAVSWAVAGKLLQGKADELAVPTTWREAHMVFWQHPTVICASVSLLCAACSRLLSPVSWLDGTGADSKWFELAALVLLFMSIVTLC